MFYSNKDIKVFEFTTIKLKNYTAMLNKITLNLSTLL